MYAPKCQTTITADPRLHIEPPHSFPVGKAEMIVPAKSEALPTASQIYEERDDRFIV